VGRSSSTGGGTFTSPGPVARTTELPPPIAIAVASSRPTSTIWLWRIVPPLLFLAITIVFVWPLPLHLSDTAIRGESNDIWVHLWWMWQVRDSLLHGHNPYWSNLVFHPFGAPLYLMGQDMVTALLSIPLQGPLGLVTSYNLLTIVVMAFAAWTAYLLALDVTGSRPAALVAGAIYGFTPLQSSFLNLGQMEFVNVGFLPLTVLFLLRLRRLGPWWVPPVGGLCLALTILSSWYQGMFCFLFTALYVGWELLGLVWQRRWQDLRDFIARLVVWGITALVLVSPVLLPTLRLAGTTSFAETAREAISYSAIDVFDPVRPNLINPLAGAARAPLSYALGYIALALALLGLWRAGRRGLFWALTVVVFYLLALGPFLKIGARQWDLPYLPYNLLYALPVGNIARAPVRFLILISLALSILAAWGVSWLGERLALRLPARATLARTAVGVLALVLVLAEWFPAPRALASTAVEPYYTTIANGPPGAVYELPYDDRSHAQYRATVHGRPVLGGYIARNVPYPLLNGVPVLTQLRARTDRIVQDLTEADIIDQLPPLVRAVEILDAYDIRYVILRRDGSLTPDDLAALQAALEKLFPADLIVHDGATMRVYRIPQAARSGVVVGIGVNWYGLEQRADTKQPFRWSNGNSTLAVTLLDAAPRTATLTASLLSYNRPTQVEVYLNERLLATVPVETSAHAITVSLPLEHGYNELRLHAVDPPIQPSTVGGGKDNRFLSIGVSDVRVSLP
jgi:hypothetical protein